MRITSSFLLVLTLHIGALIGVVSRNDYGQDITNQSKINVKLVSVTKKRMAKKKVPSKKPSQQKTPFRKEKPVSAEEQVQTVAKSGKLTNDLKARYLATLSTLLEQKKFYPRRAKLLRQFGTVNVSFKIDKEGNVVEIMKLESPFRSLKNAVKELLTSRVDFPGFKEILQEEVLEISLSVNYQLQ